MSCFWDAIRASLTNKELEFMGVKKNSPPIEIIKAFQKHNRPCLSVLWNNQRLSRNNLRENFKWVCEYKESGTNGHMTSTCDPFLCLIVELFCVKIQHKYLNNLITYTHSCQKHVRSINYNSNKGHFSLG